MSEHKSEIKQKIHNVKGWLDSAENNFQRDQELKGQLNLMLAQAEMQTLNNKNKSFHKKYKRYIFFGIVILVFTVSMLYNLYINNQNTDIIIKNDFPTQKAVPPKTETQPVNTQLAIPIQGEKTPEATPPLNLKPSKEETLDQDEKRNLVRRAQQSLHGELKTDRGIK